MKLVIVRKKNGEDKLHYKITGEMNVYSAVKLKDVFIKELKACSGITLDLAGVDEADTAGFQLLLFLKREAQLMGKGFGITEMSLRVKNIFTLYKETI